MLQIPVQVCIEAWNHPRRLLFQFLPGGRVPSRDAVADSKQDEIAPGEAMPLAEVAIAGDLAAARGVPALEDAGAGVAEWVALTGYAEAWR